MELLAALDDSQILSELMRDTGWRRTLIRRWHSIEMKNFFVADRGSAVGLSTSEGSLAGHALA